ncbi:MAG: M1 family metallopeptidase [Phycisphaerales bacterium]|nr:M1 family metallopeptidase [Phycisphaerales bacterium]
MRKRLPCAGVRSLAFGGLAASVLFAMGCAAGGEGETNLVQSGAEGTQSAGAQNAESGDASEGRDLSRLRALEARPSATVFSPLSWPTPTEVRLASGRPGPAYWQNRADHSIRVRLDTEARRVEATQTITYHNHSPHTLDYIWLHLEQNLFRSDSRGTRMTPPGTRFSSEDGFDGGYEIESVSIGAQMMLDDGERSRTSAGWMTLYDAFKVYDALGKLDLPKALEPGESVSIRLEWAFDIPGYGADRLGIEDVEQGTIFQLAQWFPTPVKYDDVNGWNTMPYVGTGEFYTDFGRYEVEITVPRSYIVGATGVLQNPEDVLTRAQIDRLAEASKGPETVIIVGPDEVGSAEIRPAGDGELTWRYEAEDVRSFAWTASDAFIWDASAVQGSSVGTMAHSLYPKEALPVWETATDMLRFAIEGYNSRWFEYPYPTAINVSGRVRGMEYPMILFSRNRQSERGLYGLTTHEIGHNWFPMVVNSDERRHMWFDEGLTSFINIYSNLERYPDEEPRRGNPRAFARQMLENEPIGQPSMTYPDLVHPGMLGYLMYAKPAIALYQLREFVLGPDRFDDAFIAFINAWAFKSPQPADFFRMMEDGAGEDLSWFWRGWFYENGVLDQAVVGIEHEYEGDNENGRILAANIKLENRGELVMPVEMELSFEDGSSMIHRVPVYIWRNADAATARVRTDGRRVVGVRLDPRGILADVDASNDVWPREERRAGSRRRR